ncbi:MAG: cytochrome c biogenesis protein CcsA, partial [Proteobacteria bacterium]|nr:cytochrome c biogenesis protein CcsA [Pseudomonadota bacterium]
GGSWWAYYTLGWGGWWYWDPTENASFMPWLTGTALLHSMIVVEKRDAVKAWTILLAIITFSLSLLGMFLVRSGVLTSVHSFASDPARGVFILGLLVVVTGGALVLFAVRAPMLKDGGVFAPISREGSLLINNILLSVAAATVFLGTLYPLFADVLSLGKVSVGPPFFNTMFVPLIAMLVVVSAIGPLLSWKRGDLVSALRRLKWAAVAVVLTFLCVLLVKMKASNILWGGGGMALATWLFMSMLVEWAERVRLFKVPIHESLKRALELPRSSYGMTIAHMGLALLIVGITSSSLWRLEKIQVMHVGETIDVAGYFLTLKGIENGLKGPNYIFSRATFVTKIGNHFIANLQPEKRMYTVPPRPTTNAAIRSTFLGDLYVVLADADNRGGYITRIYYDPLVIWIFIGGAIMAVGGIVSMTDRRSRKSGRY